VSPPSFKFSSHLGSHLPAFDLASITAHIEVNVSSAAGLLGVVSRLKEDSAQRAMVRLPLSSVLCTCQRTFTRGNPIFSHESQAGEVIPNTQLNGLRRHLAWVPGNCSLTQGAYRTATLSLVPRPFPWWCSCCGRHDGGDQDGGSDHNDNDYDATATKPTQTTVT
jgi:hypothetical protein